MNMINTIRGKLAAIQLAALALVFGLMPGLAMATATNGDTIVTAIDAGKADAIKVAVAVVLALWAIWTVYLLRRRG